MFLDTKHSFVAEAWRSSCVPIALSTEAGTTCDMRCAGCMQCCYVSLLSGALTSLSKDTIR